MMMRLRDPRRSTARLKAHVVSDPKCQTFPDGAIVPEELAGLIPPTETIDTKREGSRADVRVSGFQEPDGPVSRGVTRMARSANRSAVLTDDRDLLDDPTDYRFDPPQVTGGPHNTATLPQFSEVQGRQHPADEEWAEELHARIFRHGLLLAIPIGLGCFFLGHHWGLTRGRGENQQVQTRIQELEQKLAALSDQPEPTPTLSVVSDGQTTERQNQKLLSSQNQLLERMDAMQTAMLRERHDVDRLQRMLELLMNKELRAGAAQISVNTVEKGMATGEPDQQVPHLAGSNNPSLTPPTDLPVANSWPLAIKMESLEPLRAKPRQSCTFICPSRKMTAENEDSDSVKQRR